MLAIAQRGEIFILSLVVLLSWGASAWLAGEEPGGPLAEQVAAIGKENQALEQWFRTELRAADHESGKVRKANEDYWVEKGKLKEKLAKLITENGPQPEAFDAMLLLVGEVRYPLDEKQANLVLEHHLANSQMGRFCFSLRSRGDEKWAMRIMSAAADKHPLRDIRGQATFALGDATRQRAFPYGREVPENERAQLLAQAAQFYQRTIDQYADVFTPEGKKNLGEKAKRELNRIKNLPNLVVGGTAPPIEGKDLAGEPLSLEDYRGKVVLLVFWGSWCGPCMAMVPHERELFVRHRDKPFVLLGVNCGDTREQALATVKEKEMAWRHWWDGEEIRGPIETDYNVPHWPRIFVIDAKGVIRGIDPEGEELDGLIERALGEG